MKKTAGYLSFFLVLVFLSSGLVYGQNDVIISRKKLKEERLKKKKARAAKLAISRAFYSKLLQKKDYVFTANTATNKEGVSFPLDNTINFMSVINDTVVFQFSRLGQLGWNGVGGITSRGIVANYKFDPGTKKRGMTVTSDARMLGPGLPPRFTLNVSDDGTSQLVIYFGNGGIVTLSGQLYSPAESGVYQGQSAF